MKNHVPEWLNNLPTVTQEVADSWSNALSCHLLSSGIPTGQKNEDSGRICQNLGWGKFGISIWRQLSEGQSICMNQELERPGLIQFIHLQIFIKLILYTRHFSGPWEHNRDQDSHGSCFPEADIHLLRSANYLTSLPWALIFSFIQWGTIISSSEGSYEDER